MIRDVGIYWVVRDKVANDLITFTLHKSKEKSLNLFLDKYSYHYFGLVPDSELISCFMNSSVVELRQVEIKDV